MRDHRDVVVVGAGLMGAAAAWAAVRANLSVAVVEQFEMGHLRGSSHGSARIVRLAYGDAMYTRLAGRAFELWRELEHEADASVLRMLGGLDFGTDRNTAAVVAGLAAISAEHELLDAVEAERRWPGMRFEGQQVVYHPQAGVLDAARAVETFLRAAATRGAVVEHGVAARAIEAASGGVRIDLSDGSELHADHVVIAAGAWVPSLVGNLVALPTLTVTQQQVFHFPRRDPSAPAWPSVIHDDGHGVYHLAGGRDGGPDDDRKIGEHDRGMITTADTRDGVIDRRSQERVVEYVRRWLPGLESTPRSATTCLYTTTPTEDFVLDRVGPMVVCSPCSGHGAKFAPLVGELVVDLIRGGSAVPDRFRLAAHAAARGGKVSL